MNLEIWLAISKRHRWYLHLLTARLTQSTDRMNAQTEASEITRWAGVVQQFNARVRRHCERMKRHREIYQQRLEPEFLTGWTSSDARLQ